MINLSRYRQFFEQLINRLPIDQAMPVAVDRDMGKRIQALPTGSVTLFVMPPGSKSASSDPDAYQEEDPCLLFVMEKFDPQRKTAFTVLEDTQIPLEALKHEMIRELGMSCAPFRLDVSSITILPETEFFANFAGWSIEFTLKEQPWPYRN